MLTYGQKMELEITERATAKAQRDFLLRLLGQRFGALPETVTARIGQAGTSKLEQWARRILDATSLDDVFAE